MFADSLSETKDKENKKAKKKVVIKKIVKTINSTNVEKERETPKKENEQIDTKTQKRRIYKKVHKPLNTTEIEMDKNSTIKADESLGHQSVYKKKVSEEEDEETEEEETEKEDKSTQQKAVEKVSQKQSNFANSSEDGSIVLKDEFKATADPPKSYDTEINDKSSSKIRKIFIKKSKTEKNNTFAENNNKFHLETPTSLNDHELDKKTSNKKGEILLTLLYIGSRLQGILVYLLVNSIQVIIYRRFLCRYHISLP